MAAANHSLYVHLVATLGQFTPRIAAAGRQLDDLNRRVGDGSTKTARALDKTGKAAMLAGGAVAVGMGMAVRAAVQWETAWAGVLKTATADSNTLAGRMQLDKLEKDLRGLASTLPTTHTEIAAVAEAAGQLGVATPDVARFTKTMVDLGVSTNLSAEDAATGLARMMNVMQTAPADVDRMGAALVALGNAGASTEAEILHMATRIAGAGNTVGATEADVLALSNALSSMGVNAELGSGVMTRTLLELETAAASGASGLEDYAKIAGVTASEFAQVWERSPIDALNMVTQGVGRLQETGGNAVAALESIGAQGTLDKQVLLALAGAGDLLTNSLELGARSWEENAALAEEAGKRYDTTESRMKIAKNTLHDFAIDLGTVLLPAVAQVAEGVTTVGNVLRDLPGPVKQALAVLATVGASFALVGGAALIMLPKIAAAKASLVELGIISATTSGQMGRLATVMKIVGSASVVGAIAAAGWMIADTFAKAGPSVESMTQALLHFDQEGKVTGPLAQSLGADLEHLGATIERATENSLAATGRWFLFLDDDNRVNIKEARNDLDSLDKSLAALVQGGQAELAESLFRKIAVAAEEQGVSTADLDKITDDYRQAVEGARIEQEAAAEVAYAQADALVEVQGSLDTTYSSLGRFAEAQGYSEEQTKDLIKQVEAWGESLAEFVNPLGAYEGLLERKTTAEREHAQKHADATEDSTDTWEQYVDDVSVSVTEYLAELERMVADQEAWAGNMTVLAGRVSTSTLDELARMGPEGAPLVAKLVNASDEELARMDDLLSRRTKAAVDGQAEQWRLWGELAPRLTGKIGKEAVAALGRELAAGTTTVAQIAAQYAAELAGGINPLLVSIGGRKVNVSQQAGRGYSGPLAFAEGGPVWGAGTATSDSIPALLSDGEYVIRASAVQSYGQDFLDAINESRYARGGFVRAPLRFAQGGYATTADVPRPPTPGRSGPPVSTAATATMDLAYQAAMQAVRELAPRMLTFEGGASAKGLNPQFLSMFQAYNAAIGGVLRIVSGWRSSAQQAVLYDRWQRRVPGQAPAAPPGRSNHERGLAIDHAPHSTASMRATAGRFGLRYPMSYEPWHVEPARISRARGGPVGRATRHASKPVAPAVSPFASTSITTATRGMTDVEAIRKLTEAWERYNDELDLAKRRQDLLADDKLAQTEYDKARAVTRHTAAVVASARGTASQAAAVERHEQAVQDEAQARERALEAIETLHEFDRSVQLDRERSAVDRLVAKLEDEAAVRAELARIRDDQLGTVNGLLDEVAQVRKREGDALEAYNERAGRLATERAEAERRLHEETGKAQQRLADQQEQLLSSRARQLEQWSRLDQQTAVGWGNTVEQLLTSATRQAAQFDEWTVALAEARARGVSEQVVAALGLDAGPQALGQLRQFGKATQTQIDELNTAVAARQRTATEQAHVEAVAGYGQLGADLVAAHDTYTTAVGELEQDYLEATRRIDEQLDVAQTDLRKRQEELADELARIGQQQGRSYADALAEGLRSGIPAVVAAAEALQAAARNAAAAGAGSPGVAAPGAPPRGTAGYVSVNGQRVHVNEAGIIDTPGAYYGKYPAQVLGLAGGTGSTTGSVWGGPIRRRTYDTGGWLEPGYTLAYNGTGQRERVVGPAGSGGGDTHVRVFIGDRELTDIVDVQIDTTLGGRQTASLIAGRA